MATPARQLTHAVRDLLTLKGWLVWRNGASAMRVGDRFFKTGQPGLPDLMAVKYFPGGLKFLACEIKAGRDTVKPNQQAMLDALAAHGAIVIIARTVADVAQAVEGL
jgi:hypothetical protein